MLFGFDPKDEKTIRNWLSEVLPVLSFNGVSNPHSRAVSTLEEAMIRLGRVELSRETPNLSFEYVLDEYPPLKRPVVFFSGLDGADTVALLEAWQEFTGKSVITSVFCYIKIVLFVSRVVNVLNLVDLSVYRNRETCCCHSNGWNYETTSEFVAG